MRKIDFLFNEYSESHQNSINKRIHWICVPLIFWSILGFISLILAPHFCIVYYGCISIASLIAIAVVSVFYFRLSWRFALAMLGVMLLFDFFIYLANINLGRHSWMLFGAVFIVSWIFQFIGHKVEGKKPSFLKDLHCLLVGSAWLLHFIFRKVGIKY